MRLEQPPAPKVIQLQQVPAGREAVLAGLRSRIRVLERPHGSVGGALAFGVAAIDRHLPDRGLTLGALHEVEGAGSEADSAAAILFIAGVLARTRKPVLWCLRRSDLFAPALAGVGLHPDRVIFAEAARSEALLTAMEEGLRHGGLGGVVGEVDRLSLLASRRLQLASEVSGTPAFALYRWKGQEARQSGGTTAAVTRWRVSASPSAPLPSPGIGRARWILNLIRCRNGEAARWIVEAPDAEGRLAEIRGGLFADLADGSAEADGRRAAS